MDKKTFDIISRISEEHCKKTFGYLDEDDLKNEIWAICLEKLPDYNVERGELEHFLRVSVKNRLVNRFKDITKSVRSPCPRCPYFDITKPSDCAKFGDERHLCSKWHNYQLSVESRNSLLNASEEQKERSINVNVLDYLSGSEIKKWVIENIDISHKHDLIEWMSGSKISKQRVKKVKKAIQDLINRDKIIVELTINGKKIKK